MTHDTFLVDSLLKKLQPEWGPEKIEALKLIHQLGDEDRRRRIERLAAISARKLIQDDLLGQHVLLPPSPEHKCQGQIYLGDVCYGRDDQGKHRVRYPLFLDYTDIKNHMIVTGLSGVGKTTLAYNLMLRLAEQGTRCIIFDWDRTWRNFLSLSPDKHPFVNKIRVYTIGRDEIAGFSWNMFFSPPPNVKFSNWLGIASSKPLQKSLLAGQGVEDFIETEAEQLMASYQDGILKLLPNIEDIKLQVQAKAAKARRLLWKQSTERVVKELTRECVREVFGSRNPMDIPAEILERDGITIFEMDIETPAHLRVLFQEVLLTYFMLYYLHKGEAAKDEIRSVIFLEEFPNMLPQSDIEKAAGAEIIRTMFKESRKFGVGLVAIAQEPSELPNYVTANCKIQAHFAVQTKRDIEASAGSLFLKQDQIDFLDLIWQGEAIVKVKGRVRNCLVKTPPSPITGKITDEELCRFQEKWQHQN